MNKHKSDWHEEYLFYLVWILWWWVGVNNMNNNNDNRKLQQYWHILIHHSHTYRVFLPGKNVASFVSKCKILFKICLRFVEKFSHFKIGFLCKIVFFQSIIWILLCLLFNSNDCILYWLYQSLFSKNILGRSFGSGWCQDRNTFTVDKTHYYSTLKQTQREKGRVMMTTNHDMEVRSHPHIPIPGSGSSPVSKMIFNYSIIRSWLLMPV